MDYNKISDFLEKFKKTLFQKEEIYKIISEEIYKKTNILIKLNLIKIKNNIIFLDCSPVLKNEILINQKEILISLKNRVKNHLFVSIK